MKNTDSIIRSIINKKLKISKNRYGITLLTLFNSGNALKAWLVKFLKYFARFIDSCISLSFSWRTEMKNKKEKFSLE